MMFRRILGISTATLAAGLVGANCGVFSSTKWSSSEILDSYKKDILNPFRYINIIFPRVFASLNSKVTKGYERLKRGTDISDDFLRSESNDHLKRKSEKETKRYYYFEFLDFFLYFDSEKMNPAVVYEFLTPVNVTGKSCYRIPWSPDKRYDTLNSKDYTSFDDCLQENFTCTRGHMAPMPNHKQKPLLQKSTFKHENSAPMNKVVNGGVWSVIEDFSRELTSKHGKVHIFTGPIYKERETHFELREGIEIPTHFFKVIIVEIGTEGDDIKDDFVAEREGGNEIKETEPPEKGATGGEEVTKGGYETKETELQEQGATGGEEVTNKFHVISFIVPNSDIGRLESDKRKVMFDCLATLDEIECYTKLNMFTNMKEVASLSPSGDCKMYSDKLSLPQLWEKEKKTRNIDEQQKPSPNKMGERFRPQQRQSIKQMSRERKTTR